MFTFPVIFAVVAINTFLPGTSAMLGEPATRVLIGGLTDQAQCERIAADLQKTRFDAKIYCVAVEG